jgi:hypothetical protein
MSMTRSTSIQIALALVVSSSVLAIGRAEADCSGPETDRELCRFHPYVAAPALVAELFVPSRDTTWLGGGLQFVLYGWSDNNERPGPGQGSVFAQFSVLDTSGVDRHLFLLRAGATLSLERNAARRWLIPYYGFAVGAMRESLGTRGFVEATLGAYVLHSRHVVVSVDGGYLLPFSEIDELAGIRMQLTLTIIPW